MIVQLRVLDDDGTILQDERRYFGTERELRDRCEHMIGSLQLLGSTSVAQLAMKSRAIHASAAEPTEERFHS